MVLDFGTAFDDQLYLAMELVEGVSLGDLLSRQSLPFSDLRQIFDQLLGGLAHAHGRGVVHRDIKPGNVLLTSDSDGRPFVKIVDFGIATFEDDAPEALAAGRILGTPLFMAPEQARGDAHLTTAVDVYTVGLMLFWALTGRHAFGGATPRAVRHRAPRA
jgi:serine/threonine-protein kinase